MEINPLLRDIIINDKLLGPDVQMEVRFVLDSLSFRKVRMDASSRLWMRWNVLLATMITVQFTHLVNR